MRGVHCVRCAARFAEIGLLSGSGSRSGLSVARLALASAPAAAASATAIAWTAIFALAGALLLRPLLAVAVIVIVVHGFDVAVAVTVSVAVAVIGTSVEAALSRCARLGALTLGPLIPPSATPAPAAFAAPPVGVVATAIIVRRACLSVGMRCVGMRRGGM